MNTTTNLIIYLGLILFLFGMYSCDDPVPDEVEDLYPQEQIPWPSLADTPWPMFQHDPQHTGRSEYRGPAQGILENQIALTLGVSGAVVGFDSTIYIGTTRNFYCFDYSGNEKWQTAYTTYSTPIIGADSTIFVPGHNSFQTYTPTGNNLWLSSIDKMVSIGFNIDRLGNMYYIDENTTLNVIDPNGNALWILSDSRIHPYEDGAPTFSPDGNTLYVQGDSVSLLAIDINSQSILWTFGEEPLYSSPAVDNAGKLYFVPGIQKNDGPRTLYCLDPNGEIVWQFDFVSERVWDNTEITIDHDGNIYFASDTLYAFDNMGELKWKEGFDSDVNNICPLICDSENTVYVGAANEKTWNNFVMAIDSEGTLLWELNPGVVLGPSPAIVEDGTLLYSTWEEHPGYLLMIK